MKNSEEGRMWKQEWKLGKGCILAWGNNWNLKWSKRRERILKRTITKRKDENKMRRKEQIRKKIIGLKEQEK